MKSLYYTTLSCAKVISPFWYYNAMKHGNLEYCDGTDIRDYIDKETSNNFEEVLLMTQDNKYIVTSEGLKIALNI